MDLQAIQFGERPALSRAVDHEDFGRSAARAAARGVQIAFGIGGQGPEIGRGGIEDLGELGSKKDAAIRAQRQILQRSTFEIGAVAMLLEVGVHGEAGGQGAKRHQEESNCFHR